MVKFAFFGTPEFSEIVLDGLEEAEFVPSLVVTQPDRPKGRGKHLVSPPAALWAKERGIALLQPQNCRGEELLRAVRELSPDVAVTAAFGQILPKALLELPAAGFLNVHPSLLPKYRGASPVQAQILADEPETGVTVMQVDQGLDTGPVVASALLPMDDCMTAGELSDRLAVLGGHLLAGLLDDWVEGRLQATPQDDALATMTHRLKKEDGRVDFTQSARIVYNRIRDMTPWPGAYAYMNGKVCKLLRARIADAKGEALAEEALISDGRGTPDAKGKISLGLFPGMIVSSGKNRMFVRCGSGWIELLEIQMPSKAPVRCCECAHNFRPGLCFGS